MRNTVVVVQSLNHGGLFATPWTEAHQALLFVIISWSLLKFMSIEYQAQFTLIHGYNFPDSYETLCFTASDCTFTTRHTHNWASFPFLLGHFILSGAISNRPLLFPSSIVDTFPPGGAPLPMSYLFAFLYCSWGSRGKTTGVVFHFLLQWTTFCQNSSLPPLLWIDILKDFVVQQEYNWGGRIWLWKLLCGEVHICCQSN